MIYIVISLALVITGCSNNPNCLDGTIIYDKTGIEFKTFCESTYVGRGIHGYNCYNYLNVKGDNRTQVFFTDAVGTDVKCFNPTDNSFKLR